MMYQYFDLNDKHVSISFDGAAIRINDKLIDKLFLERSYYGDSRERLYAHTDEAIFLFDVTDGFRELWNEDYDHVNAFVIYAGIVTLFDISNKF